MTERPAEGSPSDEAPDPQTPQGWGPAPAPRWGQYSGPQPPQAQPGQAPGQPGQHGQPGQAPGQHGQYGQYGAPAPGYQAPQAAPRPGIIPLRPLSLGELLDGAFRAIRTNPRVMFGLSAAVVTVTALIQTAVTWTFFRDLEALTIASTAGTTSDLEAINAALGDLVAQIAVAIGASVVTAVVTTILSGLLIISVSEAVLGRKASLAQVWSAARGRILRLLVLSLLVLLIVASPIIPFVLALIAAIAAEQAGITVVVALLGGLATVVAAVYLLTKTLLATPALMLERASIGTALRRGWTLTGGTFWRVLGTYLLTSLLVAVVAGAISGSTSVILQFTAADPATAIFSPTYLIGSTIAQILAAALTTPFTAAVVALLYIDVRMRTEGLDLELARAAGRPA